jgi:hypothetical protein
MHVAVRGVDPGEDPEVRSRSLRASDATAGIAQIEHVELAVGVPLCQPRVRQLTAENH